MTNTVVQYVIWLAAAAILFLFLKRRRGRKAQS